MRKKNRAKKTSEKEQVDPRFAPVVAAFRGVRGIIAGRLMASYGLKVNGRIFAMYVRGKFVVKLPKERVDELVEMERGERFSPGNGRAMKEWIAMEDGESDWVAFAREALEFVKRLK